MLNNDWSLVSWKSKIIRQIPEYPNEYDLDFIKEKLNLKKPLVSFDSILEFKNKIKNIEKDKSFIFQGGDCAESFSNFNEENIVSFVKLFEEIKKVLSSKNIIAIGRVAGQFAKPRSNEFEVVDGKKIYSYKGDIINSPIANEECRFADPNRMLDAYNQSQKTIALLNNAIYTSHEALLLHYEESMVRVGNDKYYLASTHLPWIGARTCFSDGCHIEFLRGVINPIGIKYDPSITSLTELKKIIKILNPTNESGKIVIITRFGCKNTLNSMASLIKMIKIENLNVVFVCDPMHGNNKKLENGNKIRFLSDIINEINDFYNACKYSNVYIGGVHLEMTAEDVLECFFDEDIKLRNYKSLCDPRLNKSQVLDIISKCL